MISKYELFSSSVACLYRDIQKIERTEMAKFGLKGPHAQCLLVMSRFPEGITSARLCEACDKDKAAVSRTIAELEQQGLIARKEKNGIRYRSRLTLTQAGYTAAEAVSRKAQQAVELAGAGLDNQKREIFYEVLTLIAGNLHTICRDGLQEKGE